MIIGGKAIYDEFFELAERIYYTAIHMTPERRYDLFPQFSAQLQRAWMAGNFIRVEQLAGERDEADMTFVVLEK